MSSLTRIDYADLFTIESDLVADPERWARALFGDVPSAAEIIIWQGLLSLRLTYDPSPFTVAGWAIGGRGDGSRGDGSRGGGWIRLEQESWLLTANLVVDVAVDGVSLATFVQYSNRFGRVVWPPLSLLHRFLVPGILRGGARTIAAARPRAAADEEAATRQRKP